ncbi:NAC domain-containing protein 90-like [Punica granatum]|uniref:NAC domain-containing protein n=2 Tax=Punica granatum TaxID=22663 RepID=A0A218X314_PUNGR|nr:NAC domain-containing protein 90-like [Punica granatum]OWM79070.1 hypothetical protein CDL15_Pgr003241 [Punica granatum]PKI49359.1 hypothetical protein CRG98_030287 [Punica granatum]
MNDLPGFRFFPTEEELVLFYLHNKLNRRSRPDLESLIDRVVPLLDIYEFNPWELPQFAGEPCQGDPEQWFFFIPRQESEARGGRPKRLTASGYWKATGSPGLVYSSGNRIIGVKRTMVFYSGRAPAGRKTEWKMNEYKAIEGEASSSSGAIPKLRQEYSLCRVYKQSKCVRAFDRRPLLAVGSTAQQQEQLHGSVEAVASSSSQNSPGQERISGSPGNASSCDDGDPPVPSGGTVDGADDLMNMEWLDQDQLTINWFHGIQ